MKVKPYAIGGTANASVGTSSNPWAAMVAANNNNGVNSTESVDDVANAHSPTILTRFRAARSAAAAAAAAQQASNSSHSVNKSFGATTRLAHATSSSSTLGVVVNGHKSQHHIGKIVKPIPVRPMSSSASSTHSSSYHHHHHQSHHQNQQQLVNFISNSLNSTGVPTTNPDANEFSLIAKYFASFPATRLKTSTNNVESDSPSTSSLLQSNQGSSNASISPILNQNTSNSKRTPFLPFKKSSISTASTTNMPSNAGSGHHHHHHHQDLARVTGLVATPSSLVPIDLSKTTTNEHHPYNLRNHHNTDHLCSNFRRMIKLNESHILAHNEDSNNNLNPSSPYTAASNTPTGCLLDSNNDSNDSFTHNFNQAVGSAGFSQTGLNNDSLIMPPPSITDRLVASTSADRQASSSSRFAQITMETRLTRKFLIKHHPYLQYHGGHNSAPTIDNKQSTQQPPRPSINLIKMKKLANKRLARQQETGMNNGSCINDSHQNDDSFFSNSDPTPQKLLKFTDMAPSPGLAANNSIISSLRSTKQRSIKQQASKTSIRTRRNSSMIETDWANESADKTVDCMNSPGVNSTLTSTPFTTYNNANSSINNPSLTNCGASSIVNSNNEFDDSKEDSSGYYSSYHSTDLISSSGGSVVGVGDHGVLLLGKHIDQPTSTNSKTSAATTTNQNTGNSSANTSTNQTSHHHYHTRYSNAAAAQSHSSKKMPSTPPTTRLRYHQQQLATNNDLDLDQIEND